MSKTQTLKGKTAASKKGLPSGGMRLGKVKWAGVVSEAPRTIVEANGWSLWGNSGVVHIRQPGEGGVEFTKYCKSLELWVVPFDRGDPASWFEIRFVQDDPRVMLSVGTSVEQDHDCRTWCECQTRYGGSDSKLPSEYARAAVQIPNAISHALLLLFPAGVVNGQVDAARKLARKTKKAEARKAKAA